MSQLGPVVTKRLRGQGASLKRKLLINPYSGAQSIWRLRHALEDCVYIAYDWLPASGMQTPSLGDAINAVPAC